MADHSDNYCRIYSHWSCSMNCLATDYATLNNWGPVWARERCRISSPRFLAECRKRQLNQGSFVLLYFRLFTFLICIEFVYLYFPVLFCLSVSVMWLAVKTASKMTYIVLSGELNSTPTNPTSVRPILRIGEYSLVASQHRRIRYIGLRVSADVE